MQVRDIQNYFITTVPTLSILITISSLLVKFTLTSINIQKTVLQQRENCLFLRKENESKMESTSNLNW